MDVNNKALGSLSLAQRKGIFEGQISKAKSKLDIKPSNFNNLEKKSDMTVHKMSLKKKMPIKQPGKLTRSGVVY
jgi:hypothetical protein